MIWAQWGGTPLLAAFNIPRQVVFMGSPVSRRQLLATGVAGAIAAPATVARAAEPTARTAAAGPKPGPLAFRYCLNTATLRGQKLSIAEEVAIAHRAGYQGIEPWIEELDRLVAAGGSLSDLRKQIADAGLRVESAIGFAQWCVDDPVERKKGLEEARRTMGLVAEIGGTRIAAPPAGAKDKKIEPGGSPSVTPFCSRSASRWG